MSDDQELDHLKAALKTAEPQPNADHKADAMARAMHEFDRVQGSADGARQMSNRPNEGASIWTGVTAMFNRLTSRATLAGTASIAAVAVAVIVVAPNFDDPMAKVGQEETATPKLSDLDTTAESSPRSRPENFAAAPEVLIEPAAEPSLADTIENAVTEAEAPSADAPVPTEESPLRERSGGVQLSGSAEMGIVGDRSQNAPQQDDTTFNQDVDIQFSMEPGSDSGIHYGARVDLPEAQIRSGIPSGAVGAIVANAPNDNLVAPARPDTEAYPEAEQNPLKITAEDPVSTFSIDVDTASYGIVRSSINSGYLPNPDAVRIEEMINYFPYDWPIPDAAEAPFRSNVSVMETPWNSGTQLVTIALQGRMPALEDRPPLNLVFLIDTSGSMSSQNKLTLLKQSFRLMLSQLRPEDSVAIVTYAGSAGLVLEPTPANERDIITAALKRLDAGGSTAGQAGLQQAYATARKMTEDGEVTRILLATDGDFNVGISDPDALKDYIAKERESGTYLSVLGFGRGNLDDATMQALAQNGNGTAAYIDTLNEAQKVLVDQLSGALFPIADDVKIQVEWNPTTVAEYRLIGYETRALAREDFNNDKVDAGEIGAGHSVTAIYEITPVDSDARRTDPLRYAEAQPTGTDTELGFLRLRYKNPGEDTSNLIETPILTDTADGGNEARFAAAMAGFGQLLSDPKFLGDWGWEDAIALANASKGEDRFGYRTEAINLMRLGQSLSR